VKISNKKKSFFPSLNQDFPHISYVASKNGFFYHTVILVHPKPGKSAQLSFASKFVGDFFFDLSEIRPMSSQKFVDLGEIRPNRQNFARIFLGRNSTKWIRLFRTSCAKKNYCE
jgi:hypothetical protein